MTHNSTNEIVLLKASGSPEQLAKATEATLGTQSVKTTDLTSVQRVINSSLTSMDMRGLTGLELVFAIILVGGAMGPGARDGD